MSTIAERRDAARLELHKVVVRLEAMAKTAHDTMRSGDPFERLDELRTCCARWVAHIGDYLDTHPSGSRPGDWRER